MTRLCTVNDVKQFVDTVGRWDDSDVEDAIDFIQEEVYDECGGAVKAIYSLIDKSNAEYYVGERQIGMINNVRYGDLGSQVQLASTTHYTKHLTDGIIVLNTAAIEAHASVSWGDDYIDIEYAPGLYNKYCAVRVAQHLMEKSMTMMGDGAERSLTVVDKQVERFRKKIRDMIGPVLSSDNANYNYLYNINRDLLPQDHDKNKDMLKNT